MKIIIIFRFTMRELIKSKIMHSVAILCFFIIFVSYMATEISYGVPQRISLDFGLGCLVMSCIGMSIFMGVGLISKELDARTLSLVLSRPVRRWEYLGGRLMGMASILAMNTFLLGFCTYFVYFLLGGKLHFLLPWVIILSFLEALLVLVIVVGFSLITNPVLSVINTLVLYLAGHAQETFLEFFKEKFVLLHKALEILFVFLPDFSRLNVKDYILYNSSLTYPDLLMSFSYGLTYIMLVFLVCVKLFDKKDLY